MSDRKNQKILDEFGIRLKQLRKVANVSQEQIHYSTGIGQSNIAKMKLGKINTSLRQAAILAEFFGMELHALLNFSLQVPSATELTIGITKYLKKKDIDPNIFLRKSLTHVLSTQIIPSRFLVTPKTAREIVIHIEERYGLRFSTSQISRAMQGFIRKAAVQSFQSDKKGKFQYRKN